MNCEHHLPRRLCMICNDPGGDYPHADSWADLRKSLFPEADMDTILAHECQHGSDLRVCFPCVARDLEIRNTPPSGAQIDKIGGFTYLVFQGIAIATWDTETGRVVG